MTSSNPKRTRAHKHTVAARTQAGKRRGTLPGKVTASRAPQLSAISALTEGTQVTCRIIMNGTVQTPKAAEGLMAELNRYSSRK